MQRKIKYPHIKDIFFSPPTPMLGPKQNEQTNSIYDINNIKPNILKYNTPLKKTTNPNLLQILHNKTTLISTESAQNWSKTLYNTNILILFISINRGQQSKSDHDQTSVECKRKNKNQ